MKPYEWMVTYTPQTDWIKGGGIVVWLSFFTGIFGSGAYLASLYFNDLTGMIVSWFIIAVLKSGLHVGHAKKPFRLWRMVLKVRTSWIARGTVFTGLLALFGAIQIVLSYRMPGTTIEIVFRALTAAGAVAVMVYEGFTINYISGIPFWNSSLLPATLMSWGILSGLAFIVAIVPPDAGMDSAAAANRVSLIITLVLMILYLWNAVYAGATARESIREMTRGATGALFWIGAILIGTIVPLTILFSTIALSRSLTVTLLACDVIGGMAFTYSVFKVGVYRPLV
jgi:formate-dependent nitrite reductase membrane component NrfD